MDARTLTAVFEAAAAGQYGPMVDRATDASEDDPTEILFALATTCCGLADRLARVTGRPAPELLAEQAMVTSAPSLAEGEAANDPEAEHVKHQRKDW